MDACIIAPMPRKQPKPTTRNADPDEHVPVSIYLAKRVHQELRAECAQRTMTMGEIITEALLSRIGVVERHADGALTIVRIAGSTLNKDNGGK